jgi:hypothetical protein
MPELFEDPPPTLRDAIAEVKRELGMRRGAYPRFVAAGKLPQGIANRQVACLETALKWLEGLYADGAR